VIQPPAVGPTIKALVGTLRPSAGRVRVLERMFINGFRRTEVLVGYFVGYLALATVQAVAALTEALRPLAASRGFYGIALAPLGRR